jgi:hypothetical protein
MNYSAPDNGETENSALHEHDNVPSEFSLVDADEADFDVEISNNAVQVVEGENISLTNSAAFSVLGEDVRLTNSASFITRAENVVIEDSTVFLLSADEIRGNVTALLTPVTAAIIGGAIMIGLWFLRPRN